MWTLRRRRTLPSRLFATPGAAGFTAPLLDHAILRAGVRCNFEEQGRRHRRPADVPPAYRNFGDHESVVGNFTVNSGGVAGIRWFELREVTVGPSRCSRRALMKPTRPGDGWAVRRWTLQGNLAIGFSASSSTINPQIRYAGRLVTDSDQLPRAG